MVTLPIRLFVASALLFSVHGAAVAQLPQAPPPHPTLGEVLKEYKRWGLPLPPQEAELVRVEGQDWTGQREVSLRFLVPTLQEGMHFRLFRAGDWPEQEGERVRKVEPRPEAAAGLTQDPVTLLRLAIGCKALGWDALGDTVYTSARGRLEKTVDETVRDAAWYLWDRKSQDPGTDRAEPTRRLKALLGEDARFQTAQNRELIRDLELTLVPRTSKPGTVESLIDDLTEDPGSWVAREWWTGERPLPDGTYWKIAEKGFDAVPALLAHLDDHRLTRHEYAGGPLLMFLPYKSRVSHVVSQLLDELAGGELSDNAYLPGEINPKDAREWWAKAREIGEENWVRDRTLPDPRPGMALAEANLVLLRIARLKYPDRLPDFYRTSLRTSDWTTTSVIAQEMLVSRAPKKRVAEAFLAGTAHKDANQREIALQGLGRVDPAALRPIVLRAVEGIREDTAAESVPSEHISAMTRYISDRQCWDAIVAAVRRAPNLWLELLGAVSTPDEPGEKDAARAERLRFWLIFLDYPTDQIPPQGIAAERLNRLLGLGLPAEWENSIFGWLMTRAVIHRAAGEELARLKK